MKRLIEKQCKKSYPRFIDRAINVPWRERSILMSEAFAFCAVCDLYNREDSKGLGDEELEAIFKDWKSSKRNYGVLKPDNEAYLKSLVKDNYFRLYEKWQI